MNPETNPSFKKQKQKVIKIMSSLLTSMGNKVEITKGLVTPVHIILSTV